jgi:hypothetical protein
MGLEKELGKIEKYLFIGFIIVLLAVILVDTRFTGEIAKKCGNKKCEAGESYKLCPKDCSKLPIPKPPTKPVPIPEKPPVTLPQPGQGGWCPLSACWCCKNSCDYPLGSFEATCGVSLEAFCKLCKENVCPEKQCLAGFVRMPCGVGGGKINTISGMQTADDWCSCGEVCVPVTNIVSGCKGGGSDCRGGCSYSILDEGGNYHFKKVGCKVINQEQCVCDW